VADLSQAQTQGGSRFGRIAIYVLLGLVCLYYLLPLFILISTSLKTLDDIRTGNLLSLPRQITLEPWQKAWSGACIGVRCEGMSVYFWNSFRFVVPAVLISTLIGAFNGYVLTMWRFRGSDFFFAALMIGCFIPFQVVLLPMARTLGALGISNTIAGLIFVHVIYGVAFTTLFFRNYYVSIPDELVKAAKIEGAGFLRIWQFTQIWNDFLFGVVFSTGDRQPVTVALNNLVNTSTGVIAYNVNMAAAIIAALPTLFVYIIAGKYFVRGLTAGAVKG
jgi:glucose/mannose transport system permease protein